MNRRSSWSQRSGSSCRRHRRPARGCRPGRRRREGCRTGRRCPPASSGSPSTSRSLHFLDDGDHPFDSFRDGQPLNLHSFETAVDLRVVLPQRETAQFIARALELVFEDVAFFAKAADHLGCPAYLLLEHFHLVHHDPPVVGDSRSRTPSRLFRLSRTLCWSSETSSEERVLSGC